MDIIEIRAHHIEGASLLFHLSKKGLTEALINEGYVENSSEPFVNLIKYYLLLFRNSSQKFKLGIGKLDFICESCPKLEKGNCDLQKQEFGGHRGRDSEIIEEYKLKINRAYTSAELRKNFCFNIRLKLSHRKLYKAFCTIRFINLSII